MRFNTWQIVCLVLLVGAIAVAIDAASRAMQTAKQLSFIDKNSRPYFSEVFRYVDLQHHFSMAVPAGWQPIVAAEPVADEDAFEQSYAVGFSAPRESALDQYADYLMVEILPGSVSGNFESTGEFRESISIDGRPAVRDKVRLLDQDMGTSSIDLVVFQAHLQGIGFTVGIYAIGEQHQEPLLAEAFELMLQTLELNGSPFQFSQVAN